jgi:hypothetical protein
MLEFLDQLIIRYIIIVEWVSQGPTKYLIYFEFSTLINGFFEFWKFEHVMNITNEIKFYVTHVQVINLSTL